MKTHFAKIILGIFVSISSTLGATDGTITLENVEVLEAPTEEHLDSMEGILAAWVSRIQTTEGQNTLHTLITRVLREQGTIENMSPWSWKLLTLLPNYAETHQRCGLAFQQALMGGLAPGKLVRSCHSEMSTFKIEVIHNTDHGTLHLSIRSITRHTDYIENGFIQNILEHNLMQELRRVLLLSRI